MLDYKHPFKHSFMLHVLTFNNMTVCFPASFDIMMLKGKIKNLKIIL